MAWKYKNRTYNLATYRKAVVAFLGNAITLVTTLLLIAGAALPVAVVAAVGAGLAIVTAVLTFLVKNAKIIDAVDGYDDNDTLF